MPLAASQLQASLLREQVAAMLRAAITDMRLDPGERITERQIVDLTGVSRPTAREALRQLTAEGILTAVPQRGVVVAAPTRRETAEIYEIRAVLEGLAGQLCARHATDDDLQLLEQHYGDLQRVLLDSADIKDQLAAKARFYDALLDCAGNATIVAMLSPLQAKITALRAATMSAPGRPAQVIIEIRAILDAISGHDETRAFNACARHVRQAARCAMRVFDGLPAAKPAGAARSSPGGSGGSFLVT